MASALNWAVFGFLVCSHAVGAELGQYARESSAPASSRAARPKRPCLSGIYPHLAYFNEEDECGTGAVVPWADRLWVITYAPHAPQGSTDKLYEIDASLNMVIRPESLGGTPANRMIHRESNQLLIGPYAIDANRKVRAISPQRMPGRLTGTARHLTDPAGKVYYATMEEGFYEVDVHSLDVKTLYPDYHNLPDLPTGGDLLPGYHGKGLYSGQGVLVYANNGEKSPAAMQQPFITSGCLAEWNGRDWKVVRRNQFTEVTGPGGIYGNDSPETDPLWSIGWDHRSLILMLRDAGTWHTYRLPKASHSYDGAHGWNTEWPRIREIGEDDLLMTMHGMFWRFPRTFSAANSAGIAPRSTYLKVIGDFCRWGDRVVCGCDDTAHNEFANKRKAKGNIAAPQSHSNLWFLDPWQLDHLGPVIGRGAVWLEDDIAVDSVSDPYLFSGFHKRGLHLVHGSPHEARVTLEIDQHGNGRWTPAREIRLEPKAHTWVDLSGVAPAPWIRLRSHTALMKATAWFHYRNRDDRPTEPASMFRGLAGLSDGDVTGGIIRAHDGNKRTLEFASAIADAGGPRDLGYYELDGELRLRRVTDVQAQQLLKKNAAIPAGILMADEASVLFITDVGWRFRLPKSHAVFDRNSPLGPCRVDREVSTERDLFNAHGTFYELPAENAGGFARVRPVATHNLWINDYCSYRGLLVMSGISAEAPSENPHIIRSDDGRAALWVGAIDDIWKLGKPRGHGGPWKDTPVKAGEPSDPYLMTGYDRKRIALSHGHSEAMTVHLELDITGAGQWVRYRTFLVEPGKATEYVFPDAFDACWLRAVAERNGVLTAQLLYE